jgi:hypothetical protein
MSRPRKPSAVRVERADLDSTRWQQHRDRQKLREEFEARERLRGSGRAQATNEPDRRRPTRAVDDDVKMWISRGYSEEVARVMANKLPSVPSAWATKFGCDLA